MFTLTHCPNCSYTDCCRITYLNRAASVHGITRAFSSGGFLHWGKDYLQMGPRISVVALGLAVILGGAALLPPRGTAQETTSISASKRKVRREVVPVYPPLAKEMHLIGKVKIAATIAADGHVVDARVIGGSPVLVDAAVNAIKQWRFEPGPKDTTETFEFEFDKPD